MIKIKCKYPNLAEGLLVATQTAADLKATIKYYKDKNVPRGVDQWIVNMSHYVHLMLYLSLYLTVRPEWVDELEHLCDAAGCPAQQIPVLEKFFEEKGVPLNEGVPMVDPHQ